MDGNIEPRERRNQGCMNGWAVVQLLAGICPIIWYLARVGISYGTWLGVYFPCLIVIGAGIVGILSNVNRIQTNLDGTYLTLNVAVMVYLLLLILQTIVVWVVSSKERRHDDQWSLGSAMILMALALLVPFMVVVTVPSTILSCIRVCRKRDDVSSPEDGILYIVPYKQVTTAGVQETPDYQHDVQKVRSFLPFFFKRNLRCGYVGLKVISLNFPKSTQYSSLSNTTSLFKHASTTLVSIICNYL